MSLEPKCSAVVTNLLHCTLLISVALDLQPIGRRFESGNSASRNDSGQVVHTHVPLSPNCRLNIVHNK